MMPRTGTEGGAQRAPLVSPSLTERIAALAEMPIGDLRDGWSQAWDAPRLLPGARLIRAWKDERHEVIVTESGFLWRGRSWVSLSAIARAITGSRRNGPAFFGLRDRDAA